MEAAEYFNCGTDDARSDFFAFNDYSWCDPSTYEEAYQKKVEDFSDYSIPILYVNLTLTQLASSSNRSCSLSEFGCVETVSGRKFGEIPSIYSSKMSPVYSGGLVYEYTKEGGADQQKYGLVDVQSRSSVTEEPDFKLLAEAFANNPPPSGDGGYKPSGEASECPAQSDTWDVEGTGLPAMPEKAKKFFETGAGQGVGLEGTGSQDVGAESSGTATAGSGAPTRTGTTPSGSGSSSDSEAAASGLRAPAFSVAPIVCGIVVLASSLLGGALLL